MVGMKVAWFLNILVRNLHKQVNHKEERGIVHEAKRLFKKSYAEFQNSLNKLRLMINQIHVANHEHVVSFREE